MKTKHLLLILFVAFAANTACAQGKKDKEKYVFKSTKYSNTIEPEKGLVIPVKEEYIATYLDKYHDFPNFSDYIWFKNEENLKKYLQIFEKKVRMAYQKGEVYYRGSDIMIGVLANAEGKINKVYVSTSKCLHITEKELFEFKDQLLQESKGELGLEFIQDIGGMNEAKNLITQFTFGIEELIDLYDGASIKEVKERILLF